MKIWLAVSRPFSSLNYGPSTVLESDGAGVVVGLLNARYYDGARGQFTSQDPVFWEVGQTSDGMAVLQNPQAQNSYSYALNNPIVNKDPTGRIVDTVADIGFIAYDLYRVGNAFVTGGDVGEELGYLGLDVAGAAIPGATGLGVAGRAAKTGGKASDWLRAGEKNTDVYIGVKNGKDSYVGISKDVNKRATQHGDRFDSLNKVTPSQYTRNEARSMEQQIKNMNPGYQNKINSISPTRQQYQAALNWAQKEINKIQKEINKLKRR